MGYQFTLETANTVANLTFSKVTDCFMDILSSDESYYGFMDFLNNLNTNFMSNDIKNHMRIFQKTREVFQHIEVHEHSFDSLSIDQLLQFPEYTVAFQALQDLSKIFSKCRIKSLLLPPIEGKKSNEYEFMTSKSTLKQLVEIHQGHSCLILQPKEQPRNVIALDAFPNFDVALRQADLWPAVLFWDTPDNYVFAPVKSMEQLLLMYKFIKLEDHPISALKKQIEISKHIRSDELYHAAPIIEPINPSHYIFQLSDLHFGAKDVNIAERRLRSLIKTQLSKCEPEDSVSIVVTGDAVDSPNKDMEISYLNFAEQLKIQCGQLPIRVLGNHDINPHGVAKGHLRQSIADSLGGYPKIEVIENAKVILLLFNSNTNGNLAEGEIGTEQMSQMGNYLDEIQNLDDYTLIAVLHHHLLPIPRPDHYEKKWYERIFPGCFVNYSLKLIDADLFLGWLRRRHVKIVLHGHKHIPYLTEKDGITVIACGSSTGQIVHKEKGKTYLSYNMLKINKDTITCTQFAEDIIGAGTVNIRTNVINLH